MKSTFVALTALGTACVISGCTTSGSSSKAPEAAAVSPAGAPVQTTSAPAGGAPASTGSIQLATTGNPPAAAPAKADAVQAAPAVCSMPLASVPPVPNFAAGMAAGTAENVGRNVTRNVGAGVAKNAVASVIPGFGAIVGAAAVDVASTEVVKTAQDMRGAWTATDGKGCACTLEFAKPGMVIAKKVITPKGCNSALWQHAARWNWGGKGFMGAEFVVLAKDNKTALARLEMKSYDYYQGTVNGELVTIWR